MQPLSPIVRRIYLALFMLLFAAMLPAVIFYADGWRYKAGFGFVRTGGIYIGVPYADADVSVNGEHIGRSGFLDRNFYLGDLAPASYTVYVERDGYRPWTRQLTVEEQLVTDARALLLPIEITPVRLMLATSSASQDTATIRIVPRATITEYAAIFAATSSASTTIPIDEQEGIGLFLDRGSLSARWIQENSFPPSQFCERPSSCVDTIVLENNARVSDAHFFRGGVVYSTEGGEVHFVEADVRPSPLHMLFFSAAQPHVRIIDDVLVVKSGTEYYEISL
jgi:hypothetical protein